MPQGKWQVLSCKIEEITGTTFLRVQGEIDLTSAQTFEEWVRKAVGLGFPVTVDLRQATYLDSRGIRALESANTSKVQMTVLVAPGTLGKLLAIAGLSPPYTVEEGDPSDI